MCSALFVSMCCVALMATLPSCSAELPIQRDAEQGEGGGLGTPYSIVCVVHGDGDYLYHDTSGIEHVADEEAVAGAIRVAQHNPQAEVFIFHQRPSRDFLFVFPLRDGEFYYYRHGRLLAHELYWRDQKQSQLDPEADLYHRFHVGNRGQQRSVFLYFGHEIPEFGGAGYDASYPDRPFTVRDLAVGMKSFTRDSGRFDLLVLSTCYGGTPYTISTVGSYARYIVASPDNLHLSYFDLDPLERLDLHWHDNDGSVFAQKFARQSFDRLTKNVETAVSVAVYNTDSVQEYIRSVRNGYEHTLGILNREVPTSTATAEHCDCADIPAYLQPTMRKGVEIFYRPAWFGRSKDKQSHSGWECWSEKGLQALTSQVRDSLPK